VSGTLKAMPDRLESQAQETPHRPRLAGVPSGCMATSARKTLLEPGHEAEWAELNREKREYHQRNARALTPSQRVAQGQKLSQQAVSLLASMIREGHAPSRAFWS
jgi:mannose/cellobiose epimerase-like protein (N-acyl-D-glucosamine 2-epimerase family)